MLNYVILGFLKDKDMTGYEMKQLMSVSTSNFLDASYGSIYPLLKKLDRDGFVTIEEVIEEGRYKKRYHITTKGIEEFASWLKQPCEFSPFNHEALVRLYFYKHLANDERLVLLNHLVGSIQKVMDHLTDIEIGCQVESDYFEYATLKFGKAYYSMALNWYNKLIKELKAEE